MKENRGSNEKGLTIHELLIMLTIIAVLSSVAVPHFAEWIKNCECRAAARNMVYVLREARSKAISTNFEHRVDFEPLHRRFRVVRGNRATNSNEWSTVVYDWQQLAAGVNISANIPSIHMNTNGTANGGTISIQDENKSTKYEVRVARTGRIHIPSIL